MIGRLTDLTVGSLEQSVGIAAIGLVAAHIGTDVLRREEPDGETQRAQPAAPEMRRAADLDHHRARLPLAEETHELGAG